MFNGQGPAIRSRVARLIRRPVVVLLPPDPAPGEAEVFFVRGHPRSGTNWVGKLLNLHPQIACIGEFHFEVFQDAMARFTGAKHHQGSLPEVGRAAREGLRQLIRSSVLTAASDMPGKQRRQLRWVGDRTPRELRPVYAGAPFFRIVRDGRDVLVSMTFHTMAVDGPEMKPFREQMAPDVEAFKADPQYFRRNPERLLAHEGWVRRMAWTWANYQRMDAAGRKRIETDDPPGRILDLRYERLHEDVEGERRRMYEFLGVDPAAAAPVASDELATPGHEIERPDNICRKGVVGDWSNYFTDDARRWFTEEAGETLIELGYEQNHDWRQPAATGRESCPPNK